VIPTFSPEHDALRASVRRFVETEITPNAMAWEAAGDFPRELYEKMGALGFLGLKFEPAYGGSGPDYLAETVVIEEMVRGGSGGVSAGIGGSKDLAALYVSKYGNHEQKQRWLTPTIAGTAIGALGVTEPGTGSDVAGITTRAVRDGDHYIVNGQKAFITNGSKADYVVTAVRTGGEGYPGISLLVIEADTPGFSTKRMQTVGWRTSHTGEIFLDDCRVPVANLLGDEGQGFVQIMGNFQWERLAMSIGAVAAAQLILDKAIAYAKEREVFGRPIARFQVWRHRFADLQTEIAAARALVYATLRRVVADEQVIREVSMCKLLTQDLAWRAADEAMQVHGGYGYMTEFGIERAWRDARLGPIGGGTDEIMREIIAKTYGL
jgi:acyl-CoA dehydrogenase